MEKLKFEFVVKSGEDPKTNVICITSITDTEDNTFIMPEHLQSMKLHDTIKKTQGFLKVKNTLQKRHEKRQVWISLTPEIADTYIDKDGNMQFKEYLLEEVKKEKEQEMSATGISETVLTKILENFTKIKNETSISYTMKQLSDKFVIEKFNNKTSNVSQWIAIFESECKRIGIEEDTKKIEVLRLFLNDSSLDWYGSMLIKHTINSEWEAWKESMCETFDNRGWSPVKHAILFKYRQGSLLEYALKKERLLLELNKSMDKVTLIDLITVGLPNYITEKIDRNKLKDAEDLFSNIRGLEHLASKNYIQKKTGSIENKVIEKNKILIK